MILISSKVYSKLVRARGRCSEDQWNRRPIVYLLGVDDKNIIREALLIGRTDSGCDEMPSLEPESLTKKYIAMAKKGLTPMGLARVAKNFHTGDAHWNGRSGSAIRRCGNFMLSLSKTQLVAERFESRAVSVEVGLTDK